MNRSIRVLVVDDMEDEALLLVAELERQGFNVAWRRVETAGVLEAALQEQDWDLVLCDYLMPNLSGPRAVQLIKQRHPDLPVIMTSARGEEDLIVEVMRGGAADCVQKQHLLRLGPAVARELEEAGMRRERRAAQEALNRLQALHRSILDSVGEGIMGLDREGRIIFINPAASKILGYRQDELLGRSHHDALHHCCETGDPFYSRDCPIWQTLGHGAANCADTESFTRKDGTVFPIQYGSTPIKENGQVTGVVVSFVDISIRRQLEEKLRRTTRALRVLSNCNRVLVTAWEEGLFLQEICDLIIQENGYTLAWIGFPQADAAKTVLPAAYAGCSGEEPSWLGITWGDDPRGRGPGGQAIRTGRTQIVQDILGAPELSPWHEEVRQRGLNSIIALPLKRDDRVTGILDIFSDAVHDFDPEEVALLEKLAEVVAMGLTALRSEAARRKAENQVQESLEKLLQILITTATALAKVVEIRDPYTAGHQERVGRLSAAIALQMNLEEEDRMGLSIAANVHDMGKIAIPSEILSKPGKLTDIEMDIIRVHPRVAYDILKDLDFPWPVAQIVLQHHERLDGSGYPQGLTGDKMLPEAKILAVADVVEAMASHRPYRPSLGIEAALEEISRNRDKLYDVEVVDACLSLFGQGKFSFS